MRIGALLVSVVALLTAQETRSRSYGCSISAMTCAPVKSFRGNAACCQRRRSKPKTDINNTMREVFDFLPVPASAQNVVLYLRPSQEPLRVVQLHR
jgi:hypothetical protein